VKIQHWLGASALGLLLGLFCALFTYSADAETQIQGFPFAFAIFKFEAGHYVDYIGPGYVILLNFLTGFATGLLFVVLLCTLVRLLARSNV